MSVTYLIDLTQQQLQQVKRLVCDMVDVTMGMKPETTILAVANEATQEIRITATISWVDHKRLKYVYQVKTICVFDGRTVAPSKTDIMLLHHGLNN